MSRTPKLWLEVPKPAFLDALEALAAAPVLPKRHSKQRDQLLQALRLVLTMERRGLVLTVGSCSSRVPASGKWGAAAVLPYRTLEVLIALARASGDPVRLEASGDKLRMGTAALPCKLEDPETVMAEVESAERELQRTSDEGSVVRGGGPSSAFHQPAVLGQLRELYPACFTLPDERLLLVAIPQFPKLLLNFKDRSVEFRVIHASGPDSAAWFGQSKVWKTMTYPAVREFGLANLIPYAASVADKSG
jgi:hypothetical protein